MRAAGKTKEIIILVADIGGTSARVALANISPVRPKLLAATETATSTITDIESHLKNYLAKNAGKRHIGAAVIAVAGPLLEQEGNRIVEMTNTTLVVDQQRLAKAIGMRVTVLNDFEALAAALPILDGRDFITLRKGKGDEHGTKALIGAGTGLGKAIVGTHDNIPLLLRSEGGHADFPFREEIALATFIRSEARLPPGAPVNMEEVISGRGIERIYHFLSFTQFHDKNVPHQLSAKDICISRQKNPCSDATAKLFAILYGRCCRNFALETYATGGIYICGGIAAKNPEMLTGLPPEFVNHPVQHYKELLERIPLFIVKNRLAGLLGAAAYARESP